MQADHNLNGLYRIILIQNKLFLTLRIKSLLAKRGRRNAMVEARRQRTPSASAGSSFGGDLQYQGQDTTSIFYAQLR